MIMGEETIQTYLEFFTLQSFILNFHTQNHLILVLHLEDNRGFQVTIKGEYGPDFQTHFLSEFGADRK